MSLRKPPNYTPAFLAANRANALRATGLQSASRSRLRELLNGLRDGGRLARTLESLARAPLPQQLDFARLYASLHKAVAPEREEMDLVLAAAAFVWRVKRRMENQVRSPRFKAQVAAPGGQLRPPWRMTLRRPGGQVTATIWIRPKRSRQGSGAGVLTSFYVGLTIRRNGCRPWQPSDGRRNPGALSSCPDPIPSSGAEAASGRNAAALERPSLRNEECNRNSSDKSSVPLVKCNKIAWQAGMSRLISRIGSYVRALTRKTEDVR